LPDKLDLKENLVWSVPCGEASSTPVILGIRYSLLPQIEIHRISGFVPECPNGTVLWKQKISEAAEKIPLNTLASCSPAAGPELVYFLYGKAQLFAWTTPGKKSGGKIWPRNMDRWL